VEGWVENGELPLRLAMGCYQLIAQPHTMRLVDIDIELEAGEQTSSDGLSEQPIDICFN
jgi:hypothetical protein